MIQKEKLVVNTTKISDGTGSDEGGKSIKKLSSSTSVIMMDSRFSHYTIYTHHTLHFIFGSFEVVACLVACRHGHYITTVHLCSSLMRTEKYI